MKYLFLIFLFHCSMGHAETSLRFNALDTIYEEIFIWICEGDTFYFDGNPLTSSGVYTATFEASNGMDSIVTLWLQFFPKPVVEITGPIEFCEGDSVEILGQYYSQEGEYIITFYYGDSCGIDVPLTLQWIDVNTEVVLIGNTLIAQNTDPIYQWFDCNTDLPIPGAIQSSFTPTVNGSYKVRLTTIEGCIEFSDCYEVSTVAVENIANDLNWSIYPNPAYDFIEIYVENANSGFRILIFDMLGQSILNQTLTETGRKEKISVKEFPSGKYFVELIDSNGNSSIKSFSKI